MSAEVGNALQKAIYDRLSNHNDLAAGVYDSVPENTNYPYVTIGDDTLIDWDTKTWKGCEVTVTIHVWTENRGRKDNKAIQKTINQILDNYALDVEGFNVVHFRQEFSNTTLDPDGMTYHGVMRFRALLQEVA